jgi:GNAT superfamily N-acetyltransferase
LIGAGIVVRPLQEGDLGDADRIFRLAFGTFLGLPDPMQFAPGADYVRTRWRADPGAAFAAEVDGRLVGSNFATSWGSVGFFGPLTVHPEFQDGGIGKLLMEPVMDLFDRWGTRHAGLFTFAQSPKHVGLYQSFGFWPRFLTAIRAKEPRTPGWGDAVRYSELSPPEQAERLAACRDLTEAVYEGLDVTREIRAVAAQELGEVVLLDAADGLAAFAVCHQGAGSEAGLRSAYIKFAAARPEGAADHLARLLGACEQFAAESGAERLSAGVSTAREGAWRTLAALGFRTLTQGISMHRPSEPAYDRPGDYVLDDWR